MRWCWMTWFRKGECSRLPAQHTKMTFDQASVYIIKTLEWLIDPYVFFKFRFLLLFQRCTEHRQNLRTSWPSRSLFSSLLISTLPSFILPSSKEGRFTPVSISLSAWYYVCVCICVGARICVCMRVCVSVSVYVCVCECMCACLSGCIRMYMSVCMRVYENK